MASVQNLSATSSLLLNSDQMIEVLRAAGESTRLRVLWLLAREELAVMELSAVLGQSQPRVSRHLKLMAEAGLIERFPEGQKVFYRLSHNPARRALIDTILTQIIDPDARDRQGLELVRQERQDQAAEYFERIAPQWDQMRSLYLADPAVEAAIEQAVGEGPFQRLVDLGTGSGRMLAVFGPKARSSVGLDLSQNMLNMARLNLASAGVQNVALRHGDIHATGLPDACADLVIIHQVLHYLMDPASAVREAARVVKPGGRLLIIDFAQHQMKHLCELHCHRWLGFSDRIIEDWTSNAGLSGSIVKSTRSEPINLTVKIWTCQKRA